VNPIESIPRERGTTVTLVDKSISSYVAVNYCARFNEFYIAATNRYVNLSNYDGWIKS